MGHSAGRKAVLDLSLVGPGFDRVVLEIMREESARAIEGEAA
jgi:hypothetical protein